MIPVMVALLVLGLFLFMVGGFVVAVATPEKPNRPSQGQTYAAFYGLGILASGMFSIIVSAILALARLIIP
jgi:hypothetical protein